MPQSTKPTKMRTSRAVWGSMSPKWKKGTKYDNPSEEIIPEKIDVLIEKVFIHQLNKFSKDK